MRPVGVERVAVSFSRGVAYFKLAAWTLFALAGPLSFLGMRNYLGVTVTGAIGIFLGLAMPVSDSKPLAVQLLRVLLVTQGLLFGGYGAFVLARPPDPWVPATARGRTSLALGPRGEVSALEFTERGGGFFSRDESGSWQKSVFPGRLALDIAFVPRQGVLYAREDRADILWALGARGEWESGPGFAFPAAIAASDTALFVATRGALYRVDAPRATPRKVPVEGAPKVVCARGRRVLAVQPITEQAAGRAFLSEDGGATFAELAGASLAATKCGVSDDGTLWVVAEGTFSGALSVAAPGGGFQSRSVPAPRVEAIAVSPSDGREAWIGVWGAGVFRSRDGGASWTAMGLEGFEVSALVVDFERGRAYAGTGSGVHELSFGRAE